MECHDQLQAFILVAVLLFSCLCTAGLDCLNYEKVCRLHLGQDSFYIDQNLLVNCPDFCAELLLNSNDSISRIIEQNAFKKFTHLSSLSLHLNLKFIDSFAWLLHLENLQFLNLSYCNLTSLNTAGFSAVLPQLQSVDLSHNSLEFLYMPFLFDAPQLKHLDISWNQFKGFPDISSNTLFVNIDNNPLECTCTNVQLNNRGNFSKSNFNCALSACPYFLSFMEPSNSTLLLKVTESFKISCNVNASNPVKFGVFSPIGFISTPSWNFTANHSQVALYEYVAFPLRRPVRIIVQRTSQTSFEMLVDYARGHHGGMWQCAALSDGGFLLHHRPYMVSISADTDQLFVTTTLLGFITMMTTFILGLIIGCMRCLIETHCFRQPHSHKFFVRPLIGVIPVPSMQKNIETFTEVISLGQRICPICFVKPAFLCGYCLSVHKFANFGVLRTDEDVSPQTPLYYGHNGEQCLVDANTLLTEDYSPSQEYSVDYIKQSFNDSIGDNEDSGQLQTRITPIPHENVLNYDFPSEFCHCYHLDMRSTDDGETRTLAALRDVKLIFQDEHLAQEYTEVLQLLQVAAKSNDTTTFRERLGEFRGRLMHDVGARVRVARDEIVGLKERSAKSVARLRDQGGAMAQLMKAGFSQVRDGMRNVAEMCTGGGSGIEDGGACSSRTTDLTTIGQSISVVSIYKDETTKKHKERCVSNFTF